MVGRLVLAVAVLGLVQLPAHAATITIGGAALLNEGQVSTVAGTTTVDFNGLRHWHSELRHRNRHLYQRQYLQRVPAPATVT